jgi:hypothetical protein
MQSFPNLVVICSASICSASKTNSAGRPEGGAAMARFLVLQHEHRRCAALGPREKQDHHPFHTNGNFNCDQKPFGM